MTAGRILAVAFLFLTAPPAGAGDGDGAPPVPAPKRSRAMAAAVDRAIDRGVAFLRTLQQPDGSFAVRPIPMFHIEGTASLGPTALALYTLRACGAPREDPDVRRGFQRLREKYASLRRQRGGLDNYGVSLTILALEAHHAAEEAPSAGDRYGKPPPAVRRMPEEDLAWMRELTAWLLAAETKRGGFSYWSPAQGETYDHSNGQFSLLALKAARRCGIEISPDPWRRALDHLLDAQERKGPPVGRFEPAGAEGFGETLRETAKDRARGWGYVSRAPSTGSMTAGGVSSLVICRSELRGTSLYSEGLDRITVQAIRDGVAWLGANFTVEANPGPPGAPALRELWHYYYLYGLERAGVLAGLAYMERHDWYLEGATFLLDEQRDNGSWLGQRALDSSPWKGAGPDAATANFLDTGFALLFLKKATFRVDNGAVATEAGMERLNPDGAADLDDRDFRGLFDAVLLRFRRAPVEERTERLADFLKIGTRAIPLLVLRLESEEEEERAAACEVLRLTVGATRGYDPAAPAEVRAPAVAAWEEWWISRKGLLVADEGAGRFLERAPPADPQPPPAPPPGGDGGPPR